MMACASGVCRAMSISLILHAMRANVTENGFLGQSSFGKGYCRLEVAAFSEQFGEGH
jgi:hypothetical protein